MKTSRGRRSLGSKHFAACPLCLTWIVWRKEFTEGGNSQIHDEYSDTDNREAISSNHSPKRREIL